ncbi:hypothetical protein [Vibrio fluvialis]|uniref:hypothetical protein n=1 Tax=Vibrio fluvialis TaxID=676 RepID=UPI003D09A008
MNPTILLHHEIGTQGYFLIQVVSGVNIENRIQVYQTLDNGGMLYLRGESWSDVDAAKEQYNAIIQEAEQAMMQSYDEDAMWHDVHYGR